MNAELKQKVIENMQWLHDSIGQTVLVEDWVSTNGRTYDRHQTTYGRQIMTIQGVEIRLSGSIATIRDENQQLEFRTDAIQHIDHNHEQLIIEIHIQGDVWRRICISPVLQTVSQVLV